jgi:hypothetical protein
MNEAAAASVPSAKPIRGGAAAKGRKETKSEIRRIAPGAPRR